MKNIIKKLFLFCILFCFSFQIFSNIEEVIVLDLATDLAAKTQDNIRNIKTIQSAIYLINSLEKKRTDEKLSEKDYQALQVFYDEIFKYYSVQILEELQKKGISDQKRKKYVEVITKLYICESSEVIFENYKVTPFRYYLIRSFLEVCDFTIRGKASDIESSQKILRRMLEDATRAQVVESQTVAIAKEDLQVILDIQTLYTKTFRQSYLTYDNIFNWTVRCGSLALMYVTIQVLRNLANYTPEKMGQVIGEVCNDTAKKVITRVSGLIAKNKTYKDVQKTLGNVGTTLQRVDIAANNAAERARCPAGGGKYQEPLDSSQETSDSQDGSDSSDDNSDDSDDTDSDDSKAEADEDKGQEQAKKDRSRRRKQQEQPRGNGGSNAEVGADNGRAKKAQSRRQKKQQVAPMQTSSSWWPTSWWGRK